MRSVWLFAAAVLIHTAPVWPAGATGIPVPAVWKEQHLNFFYMGRTSRYSCDGLREKMRAMLLDLGARRDLRVEALSCNNSSAAANVNVVFSTPALPDAAARPLHAGDLAAVDARFEAFTISNDPFRNMSMGDCELVEEFARQVLPKLAIRGIKEDITCVPNQLSGSHYSVRGEILRALPRVEQGTAASSTTRP